MGELPILHQLVHDLQRYLWESLCEEVKLEAFVDVDIKPHVNEPPRAS
jgi:hypothetical protein